ncbi:MAG: hypothetical protein ACRDEA_04505 [Microcystaceae cyanobacterium]
MKYNMTLLTLSVGLGLALSLNNNGTLQAQEQSTTLQTSNPILISQTASLTPEILKNATYEIPNQGTVKLTSGVYQSTSGANLSVTLSDKIAFGDVNGDGVNEATAILAVNTGGSNVFMYLAAVVAEDGNPKNIDTIYLGDRVKVETLAIEAEKITVKMLKHSPTDPACCPTQEIIQAYQLDANTEQLAPVDLAEEQNPDKPQVEDVPAPPVGVGDNVPYQPPEGEIEIKF